MKLKYYLRGIGLGLIAAVILYSTIIIPKYKMTDDEVIKRAEELGMVQAEEEDVDLSALTGTPEPTEPAEVTPDSTPEPTQPVMPSEPAAPSEPSGPTEPAAYGPSVSPEPDADTGSSATQPPEPTVPEVMQPDRPTQPELTKAPEPTAPDAALQPELTGTDTTPAPEPTTQIVDGKISVTVTLGMSSDAFARAAQRAGLVEDALDFDEYLMANGYAKQLRAGTYLIPAGATYEEIAERVTAR